MKPKDAEYLFGIVIESHKNTLEQYKTAATLLVTVNGGATLCLINKNIELYFDAILIFSLSMLISFLMFFIAFMRSRSITERIGNVENFSSIQKTISTYTSTTRSVYFFMLLAFGVSVLGFEYGLIRALNFHDFSIDKIFN